MTSPLQRVLDALDREGCRVRGGSDQQSAQCPAHEDREPSLSISTGDDERVLLNCHAGCTAEEIAGALGLTMRDLFPARDFIDNVEKVYVIRNPNGEEVARHHRLDQPDGSKRIWWTRNGSKGLDGLKIRDLPFYRCEDLAGRPDEQVVLAEGEKATDALRKQGVLAVGTGTGAKGCPSPEVLAVLAGRDVVLWADNDEEGEDHMQRIARGLRGVAASVRIVTWEDAPPKGDAADWTGNDDELRELLGDACTADEFDDVDAKEAPEKRSPGRPSKASMLVRIAREEAVLFHDSDGRAYADIRFDGHRETWPLRSPGFRRWLDRRFFMHENKAAGNQALQDAIGTLAGFAKYEGDEHDVHLRIAAVEGRVFLDLGDDAWRAVEVSASGWQIREEPDVRFWRPRSLKQLPVPVGGSLDQLEPFLNVGGRDEVRLAIAWLVAVLRGEGPFPILVLQGEQGSGKSTLARLLRRILDPATVDLRAPPREERDLVIAARNAFVVGIDNLSTIPPHLADAFCRLSTGGGFGTRELYQDAEEVLFNETRPLLLNGIEDLLTRPDLADRALVLRPPTISGGERKTERELEAAFAAAHPAVLGALLDALVGVLKHAPSVKAAELPRMADFAVVGMATEAALAWPQGSFLTAYKGNQGAIVETGLEGDPVAVAVRALMDDQQTWIGAATELLEALGGRLPETLTRAQGWPKSPSVLSNRLRRLVPPLRRVGIEIGWTHSGKRSITIERSSDWGPDSSSTPSTTPTTGGDGGLSADTAARHADQEESYAVRPKTGENDLLDGMGDVDDESRAESDIEREERAAIFEFEAGMSREDADREAGL